MNFVSIIMTYYQKSEYIHETIRSILKQSLKDFEIIIIDDEVSENSQKVLSEIKKLDTRIKIFKNKENLGAGQSRNNAINLCKGKYIAFCDCDDLWDNSKLEKQIKFMQTSNLEFSFTSYRIIDHLDQYPQSTINTHLQKLRQSWQLKPAFFVKNKRGLDWTTDLVFLLPEYFPLLVQWQD